MLTMVVLVFIIGEMEYRKRPSELNSKQIRVNLKDYIALKETSQNSGLTMAEIIHRVMRGDRFDVLETQERHGD